MTKIHAAVLHKLTKEPFGESVVQTRDAELKLTPPVVKLVNQITHLYGSRTNKSYGRFDEDELNYPTSAVLREIFKENKTPFIAGTKKLMAVLDSKATQAPASKGGYVLMVHGQSDTGGNWFLVAIISNVASSAVKEDNISISDAPPALYWSKYAARFDSQTLSAMMQWHALPAGWWTMSYEQFLAARRPLIADVIRLGYQKLAGISA